MTGVPLNIDWQQILLHLFNFTILFGALYILLYKPVRDFMAKRTAYYADMDTRAEDALKAAEESRESYDEKVRNFDEEVRTERSRLNKEIAESRDRQMAAAKADAEKIVSDARTEAEREKEEIIASATWSQAQWRSSHSSSPLRMPSTSSLMLLKKRSNTFLRLIK